MKRPSGSVLLVGLVMAGSIFAGCTPPSRLALNPSTGSLAAESQPAQWAPSDNLFNTCSGVTLGRGVFEMQCRDRHRFYVTRYDVSASSTTCRRIVKRLFSGTTVTSGPAIGLPDSTYTFRLTGGSGPLLAGDAESNGLAVCVPHRDGGLGLLLARPGLDADTTFAAKVLAALAYEGAPADRVLPRRPDAVPLLGRMLDVHSSCELKGAKNLSCFPNGQMNWGAFSTLERARTAQQRQIDANRRSARRVLADTTVGCTFEGTATQCRRVVYRATSSPFAAQGTSTVLIVLYATARVRGTPARAACSFYRNQARVDGLAPLCQESFEVPEAGALIRSVPK